MSDTSRRMMPSVISAGTRVAMPSAKVRRVSHSTGLPARHDRVIDGANSDCTPMTRVRGLRAAATVPMPEMPLPSQTEAEVAGLRKAIQGFSSAGLFAQYHVLMRLGPALSEVFASDDSDFAKLFSGYMTQGPNTPGTAAKPPTPMQPATGSGSTDTSGR